MILKGKDNALQGYSQSGCASMGLSLLSLDACSKIQTFYKNVNNRKREQINIHHGPAQACRKKIS